MTQAVANILEEAEQLSALERTELIDRIVESLAHDIPPDIADAQITEVRWRIARFDAGESQPIPAGELFARLRQIAPAQ